MSDDTTTTETERAGGPDENPTTLRRTRTRRVTSPTDDDRNAEPRQGDQENAQEGRTEKTDRGSADSDEDKPVIRRRRRSRSEPTGGAAPEGDAPERSSADAGGPAADERTAEEGAAGASGDRRAPTRQRRRSSRRGGGRASPAPEAESDRQAAGATSQRPAEAQRGRSDGEAQTRRRATGGEAEGDAEAPRDAGATRDAGEERDVEAKRDSGAEPVGEEEAAKARATGAAEGAARSALEGQPTRLQAKPRSRGRGRGRRGRKPTAVVSEETRRTIAESPPRRMLVQVGDERTQIAVLEERTLVEHYVTRKADLSYVGNIYLGRVQNVLPGMEAAFVDIGKGRNGVLYAGEVDYDEADLDGELPRIEQTLKPGQAVLVQVTKDPMGTKGARLTQHLSVAGRYCVLAPGDGMLGISRKLPDDERERLRQLLKELKPEGFGLIVRTAAEGVTREQLEADVKRLTRIWDKVQEKAKTVQPLEPVYEEPHLVMRVIRDVFGAEYSDLVIDDAGLAEEIRGYLRDVAPDMADKVQVYEGDERLFDAYEVTTQVRRALEKKVWLKSGGYLIIEKTEAMWVVDVNTGKFVGQDNLEETVLRNNLEAAEEIARQLRLRDMGGIIVIDFVDMLVPANRDEVLKRFKRELARDKTKSRVMDISRLGLVQMTRKNVSQGVFENFTARCETCEGRGARILDEAFK